MSTVGKRFMKLPGEENITVPVPRGVLSDELPLLAPSDSLQSPCRRALQRLTRGDTNNVNECACTCSPVLDTIESYGPEKEFHTGQLRRRKPKLVSVDSVTLTRL